jgi:hypothetical protein
LCPSTSLGIAAPLLFFLLLTRAPQRLLSAYFGFMLLPCLVDFMNFCSGRFDTLPSFAILFFKQSDTIGKKLRVVFRPLSRFPCGCQPGVSSPVPIFHLFLELSLDIIHCSIISINLPSNVIHFSI